MRSLNPIDARYTTADVPKSLFMVDHITDLFSRALSCMRLSCVRAHNAPPVLYAA